MGQQSWDGLIQVAVQGPGHPDSLLGALGHLPVGASTSPFSIGSMCCYCHHSLWDRLREALYKRRRRCADGCGVAHTAGRQ